MEVNKIQYCFNTKMSLRRNSIKNTRVLNFAYRENIHSVLQNRIKIDDMNNFRFCNSKIENCKYCTA